MSFQDILFIASNRNAALFRNDPAFVYRCENLGLSLSEQGHTVTFSHITRVKGRGKKELSYLTPLFRQSLGDSHSQNPRISPASPAVLLNQITQISPKYERDLRTKHFSRGPKERKEQYQVVVFHRPHVSFRLWLLLRQLRRSGVIVIADFDDLVFDETYVDFSPGVLNGLVSRRVTYRRFRAHRQALSWFDGITVSTEPLADHVHRLYPSAHVAVIHNSVHRAWCHTSQDDVTTNKKRIITYFPGTRSHNRDFEQICEPISRFLRAHSDVQLQITGPLEFSLDTYPDQIAHQERVPFSEYNARVRRGWVNLAPLEENPFTQCKSALKIIEAGYWGIPTICSANPDNLRFSDAGALISIRPGEWVENLERLLDIAEYRRVTHELSQRTLALANVDEQSRRFLQFAASLKR